MKLRRRSQEIRFEMTPLIDVVFLLLVFFVFAMVLMIRADSLDLRLPSVGSGATARTGQAIRVTLAQDGSLRVDGEPVEMAAVGEAVRGRMDEGSSVLLSADERAPSGVLIELADALMGAGVTEFSVLGRPAGREEPTAVNPLGSSDE